MGKQPKTTTELDRELTIYNAKIMLLKFYHSNLLVQWMFRLDPDLINVLFLKVSVGTSHLKIDTVPDNQIKLLNLKTNGNIFFAQAIGVRWGSMGALSPFGFQNY